MQMTDGEIRASYRQARVPALQIYLLAELNTCTPQRIADILSIPLPPRPRRNVSTLNTPKYRRWTQQQDDALHDFLAAGMTCREAAVRLGRSAKAVSDRKHIFKKRGELPHAL